ncbi:MAG: nitroreductase family deazaflavin-dependent oxidoreductase [Caldilineaceae bacterium]|nr:nitroreductase family deazaflavin-dependent oxidoreductase [Caldilineaceae bacterium]
MTTSRYAGLEEKARRGFKVLNRFMLLLWRIGLGPWISCWPSMGGRIMVIVHTGRKTGKRRYTPVNYAIVDGELYCTAGFGQISDWYRNLRANPYVEVWLPEGWWTGIAEEVIDQQRRLGPMRQVLIASGVVAPLVGVHPQRMSDAQLAEATATYRLIHIQRAEARTGPGGPGELSWIWPVATMILLSLLLRRRKD